MLPYGVLELRYYLAADGRSPFEEWFSGLDAAAGAKVSVALARLGQVRARRRGFGDPADRRHEETPAARYRAGESAEGGLQAAAEAASTMTMNGGKGWH